MTDRISEGGETDTYNNFQLIGTPVGKKTREIYFDFVGYLHLCNYSSICNTNCIADRVASVYNGTGREALMFEHFDIGMISWGGSGKSFLLFVHFGTGM